MKTKKKIEPGKKLIHVFRGPVTVHVLELSNPDPSSVFVVNDNMESLDYREVMEISLNCLEEVEQNEKS